MPIGQDDTQRMKRIFYKITGLTLPELLMAALILVYALCGLIALFINCNGLNEANRNTSVAVSHAQYIMESIRDTGFANMKTLIDGGNWDWDSAEITSNNLSPLRNESIDAQATGTRPLEVTVTVSWQDKIGRNRTLPITTLFQ